VRDSKLQQVIVQRYRCCRCHRTWRHYPEGIDRADQTLRLRHLAALLWTLGLSLRGVVALFDAFALTLSHMTVLRDVRALAGELRHQRQARRVRVLGLDGAVTRIAGQEVGLVVAVDLGSGEPIAVAAIEERNVSAVLAWLGPLARQLEVEVLVTDDLHSYQTVTEQLGLYHQRCLFHLRRWVGRTGRELRPPLPSEWEPILDQVSELVRALPEDGAIQLLQLWQQLPREGRAHRKDHTAVDKLRRLVWRLHHNWADYRLGLTQPDVPLTNNGTEQAIGRFKVRSRSVRGFKAWSGVDATMLLATRLAA
jgi:transposase-like protein